MKTIFSKMFLLYFAALFVYVSTCDICSDFEGTNSYFSKSTVNCPSGWAKYGDRKCFKVWEKQETYEAARELCRFAGGSLASIHSAEETNFITALALNTRVLHSDPFHTWSGYWLGANRAGKSWTWDDLTFFNYTNWDTNNPDLRDGENWVIVSFHKDGINVDQRLGKWHDNYGEPNQYPLCQIML